MSTPPRKATGEIGVRTAAVAREPNRLKRVFKVLGPGLISGAADDDPSGIGTYAVAGASLGYATLWTALVTLPMMACIQFISAKIAMVCGKGLSGVLRRYYPRSLLYPVVFSLVIANTINAGADIGAIAAAVNMFAPIPIAVLMIPIAATILALQLWGSYRLIVKTFKWLTLALFAYLGAALFARPDAGAVLRATFVPTVSLDLKFLSVLVAVFGTTLSPYLWFWQASQEVEERIARGGIRLWQRKGTSETELKYAAWDVNIGMVFSNLIMYFIILAAAATLFKTGKTDIKSAAEAAEALRPLAGNAARLLFALGLIGSGFLAVPVMTGSAAYAMAEAFEWKRGLDERPHHAKAFYGVIIASTLSGLVINFLGINPIDALFWTSLIFGFLTPPILVVIMLIANNEKIMGDQVNSLGLNVLGWATTVAMFAVAISLIVIGVKQ